MDITLAKLKYRPKNYRILKRGSAWGSPGGPIDPNDEYNQGTRVYNAGRFKAKSENHGDKKARPQTRPRRRAYGPW